MAKISISTQNAKGNSSEIKDLSVRIAQIEQEIQGIISSLQQFSGSFGSMRNSLKCQLNNVSSERQKLAVLSNTLLDIVQLYEKTEIALADNGGSREKIKEAIDKVSQHIRFANEQNGVDKCCAFGGDPVNLSNGNFIYDKSLIKLNSKMDLEFKIFYNALLNSAGNMGIGWSHSFSLYLVDDENLISVYLDDASTLNFIRVDQLYYASPSTKAAISLNNDGYLVTTKDQIEYLFDKNGRFVGKKDISGAEYVISYSDEGLMTSVNDGSSELKFKYNPEGKIENVFDELGHSICFEYEAGCLVSVHGLNERNTYFEYDKDSLLINVLDSDRFIVLSNKYDGAKRVIEQHFSDGGIIKYDYETQNSSDVTVTEQNGNRIIYVHDEQRRNTEIVYANGSEKFEFNDQNLRTSFVDRNGNISKYEYDSQGNMTRFVNACGHIMDLTYTGKSQVESVSIDQQLIHKAYYDKNDRQICFENGLGAKEYFEYNNDNLPIKWVKADGSVILMEYDEHGNMVSISNSMGGVSRYEYDVCNRTVKSIDAYGNETCYEYNESDEMVAVTDPYGNKTSYEYDNAGNMISVTDPNGACTRMKYNKMNKPIEITDACGNVTCLEYNTMSDVVKEINPNGGETYFEYDQFRNLVKVTDANGNSNSMSYDACGNMVARVDANGNIHKVAYDPLNRPVEVTTAVGTHIKGEYDALGNVTAVRYPDGTAEECTYDLTGNLLTYKNQTGYVKKMKYNVCGDLVEVSDDEGVISTYEYYIGGLLRKETNIDGSGAEFFYDKNENVIKVVQMDNCVWEFEYDSLERISKVIRNGEMAECYEYDPNGNIIALIDAENNRTEYDYNKLDKLVKVTDPLGNETVYQYDACQRLTKILRSEEKHINPYILNEFNLSQRKWKVTEFSYDSVGNVVSVVNPKGGRAEYQYDGCGNIILKKDEDGNVTTCRYDADGKEKYIQFADGKTIKYQYDALRRLCQLEDWLGITKIKSDASGRVTDVTKSEDESIHYEWLPDGRKLSVVYPNGEKLNYGYDSQRRLMSISNGMQSTQYSYFDCGKLKEKLLPNHAAVEYKYGLNGNLSELSHVHNQTIINKFIYEYDANGRKKTKCIQNQEGEDRYSYEYTKTGSLAKVLLNDHVVEEYQYDCFGNRTWKKVNGIETRYEYDSDDCLVFEKTDDNIIEYAYDLRGNIKLESHNGKSAYQYDFGAFNLLSAISTEGEMLTYQYDGFGNRIHEQYTNQDGINESRRYFYDPMKAKDHLLSYNIDNGERQNVWWDDSNSVISSYGGVYSLLHDELMSPYYAIDTQGIQMSRKYGSFGTTHDIESNYDTPFAFTGYLQNRMMKDRFFANKREFDSRTGRFVSKDMVAGDLSVPLTINPFIYCLYDPINYYDPTGMIVAWLAGGIVGAVANVAVKLGGDIVNSVKNGKPTFSSWQSYVGSATGGFVQGSVLIATGNPALAGAAGGATETLITGGLSMATGAEGYRKEDGYSWKNLLGDTAKAGIGGAVSGFVFGNAAKNIKIPGINQGRGSFQAVWKQVVTKAQKGIISNISWSTVGKGVVAYGGVKLLDTIVTKGKDAIKEYVKNKGIEVVRNIVEKAKSIKDQASVPQKVMANNLMPSCKAIA